MYVGMPRKLRIEYSGAMYHVMSRGDRREKIYLDDVDRQDFIKTLAEACQKTNWQVHAYCLMPNHYHLVLETPEPNLVAGMKWLQGIHPALGLILGLPVSAIVTWVLLPSAKRDSNLWKFGYLCSMNTAPEPVRFDVDKLKPVLHDKIECIDGRHLALLNRHQSLVTSAAT